MELLYALIGGAAFFALLLAVKYRHTLSDLGDSIRDRMIRG